MATNNTYNSNSVSGGLLERFLVLVGIVIVIIVLLGFIGPAIGSVTETVDNLTSQYSKPIPENAPTVNPDNSHAEKHEFEKGKNQEISIQNMRDCMDNGGVVETWKNDSTNHWMDICCFGPDCWGLRCVDNNNCELTGWIIDGSYGKVVENYLLENGYRAWP